MCVFLTGKKWEEKVADVRKELDKQQADMIVITAMDENAWLFNLRGGDVPHNPGKIIFFIVKYCVINVVL